MLKTITIKSDSIKSRIASPEDTFSFKPGINLLLGPNGSGKSTMFDLIASGNDGITKGIFTAEMDGMFDLRAMRMEDQSRGNSGKLAGITDGGLYAHYVISHFKSHGQSNWPILNALGDFKDNTLLLLDEPEQALDMHHIMELRKLLAKHAGRLQFIIATHHPALICMHKAHPVVVAKDPDYVEGLLSMYRKVLT